MKKKYNQSYGRYSLGTGSWLDYKKFNFSSEYIYSDQIIDTYVSQVLRDLMRIKINSNKFKEISIMDVGTGRQALAFYKIGFKKIDHFDISKFNVSRFKKHLKKNFIKINSNQIDIGSKNFKQINKKYDLIYLHGIIQHTANPGEVIKNLVQKLKPGGKIWLYHYQFGSIVNFYYLLIKKISTNHKYSIKKTFNFIKKKVDAKLVDDLMDTLGCDYIHFKHSRYYYKLAKKYNLRLIYKKDMYLNNKASLRITTPSCLTAYIKGSKKVITKFKVFEKKYDIFNDKLYLNEDSQTILKIKKLNGEINNLIKKKNLSFEKYCKCLIDIYQSSYKSSIFLNYKLKCDILLNTYRRILKELKISNV